MAEIRLLTDDAKTRRFDFVWTVEGCKVPILAQQECETVLRLGLTSALGEHGVLDGAICGWPSRRVM